MKISTQAGEVKNVENVIIMIDGIAYSIWMMLGQIKFSKPVRG